MMIMATMMMMLVMMAMMMKMIHVDYGHHEDLILIKEISIEGVKRSLCKAFAEVLILSIESLSLQNLKF